MVLTTIIHYDFPTFGLEVTHTVAMVHQARFVKWRGDGVVILFGSANDLSQIIISELDAYCNNPNHKFNLPLDYSGSDHQLKVWQLMQETSAGEVISYGMAAKILASAPRAVGGACGKNPLPIFIPCHRIIQAGGMLGGFNSGNKLFGQNIKQWLLEHEGVYLPFK